MSKVSFNFKGLMAPVFTRFNNNKEKSINVDNIDAYAKFLKSKKIHGVLVNGTSGEGQSMSMAERKIVTEEWSKACNNHQITLMVQVGGAPICDVIELAKHAESVKADAILCLPELFFKPKTELELVSYLKEIALHCKNTPFVYYHIPMFTGVTLHMPTVCKLAEKEIPNFVGLKFTSNDLSEGYDCLKPGRNILLGADTLLSAALVLGFDSAIMTTLSICPELSLEICEAIEKSDVPRAAVAQKNLTARVKEILNAGNGNWVPSMKLEFNKMKIPELNMGAVRQTS